MRADAARASAISDSRGRNGFQKPKSSFSNDRRYGYLKYPNNQENLTGKGHFLGAPINQVFVGKWQIFV
jgi:hypothetical protein